VVLVRKILPGRITLAMVRKILLGRFYCGNSEKDIVR